MLSSYDPSIMDVLTSHHEEDRKDTDMTSDIIINTTEISTTSITTTTTTTDTTADKIISSSTDVTMMESHKRHTIYTSPSPPPQKRMRSDESITSDTTIPDETKTVAAETAKSEATEPETTTTTIQEEIHTSLTPPLPVPVPAPVAATREARMDVLKQKWIDEMKKTPHNRSKKPYTQIIESMTYEEALLILGSSGHTTSDNSVKHHRHYTPRQIINAFDMPPLIHPVPYDRPFHHPNDMNCMINVYPYAGYLGLHAIIDKTKRTLTMKFRTYIVGLGVFGHEPTPEHEMLLSQYIDAKTSPTITLFPPLATHISPLVSTSKATSSSTTMSPTSATMSPMAITATTPLSSPVIPPMSVAAVAILAASSASTSTIPATTSEPGIRSPSSTTLSPPSSHSSHRIPLTGKALSAAQEICYEAATTSTLNKSMTKKKYDQLINKCKKATQKTEHHHRGKQIYVTQIIEEHLPFSDFALLFQDTGTITHDTSRSHHRYYTPYQIIEELWMPDVIHPVTYNGKLQIRKNQRMPANYTYAYAGYVSLEMNYDKSHERLILEFRTRPLGKGAPTHDRIAEMKQLVQKDKEETKPIQQTQTQAQVQVQVQPHIQTQSQPHAPQIQTQSLPPSLQVQPQLYVVQVPQQQVQQQQPVSSEMKSALITSASPTSVTSPSVLASSFARVFPVSIPVTVSATAASTVTQAALVASPNMMTATLTSASASGTSTTTLPAYQVNPSTGPLYGYSAKHYAHETSTATSTSSPISSPIQQTLPSVTSTLTCTTQASTTPLPQSVPVQPVSVSVAVAPTSMSDSIPVPTVTADTAAAIPATSIPTPTLPPTEPATATAPPITEATTPSSAAPLSSAALQSIVSMASDAYRAVTSVL